LSATSLDERIELFLAEGPWAVVGASPDRSKYGNKILRCYQQNDRTPVHPINPKADEIEGLPAFPNLSSLPQPARAISIITPPAVTELVVAEAIEIGIRHAWMQPGAESSHAIDLAEEAGMELIAGGPCLLVVLGYRE